MLGAEAIALDIETRPFRYMVPDSSGSGALTGLPVAQNAQRPENAAFFLWSDIVPVFEHVIVVSDIPRHLTHEEAEIMSRSVKRAFNQVDSGFLVE